MAACMAVYFLFVGTPDGAVVGSAALISVLGFIDDRVQLPPLAKIAGQSAATAVLIWGGVLLHCTPWHWANIVITALWVIGITNAFNLIDNMDGLSGGVAAIAAISGVILAILQEDGGRALLLAVIAGASLGFLVLNHKPAKIFMGDCGSMFLGFSLASLAIPSQDHGAPILEFLYALPAFLYPTFDTVLVSVLRVATGRPISMGGRDHSSHRLVSMGLTERNAVWILWAIAAICASCGPLTYQSPKWFIALGALLIVTLTIFGIFLSTLPYFGLPVTHPAKAAQLCGVAISFRHVAVLIIDTLLSGVAFLIAFTLWWQMAITPAHMQAFQHFLPVCVAVQAITCIAFRAFDFRWQWFDIHDLKILGTAAAAAALLSLIILHTAVPQIYSPGLLIVYGLVFLSLASAWRGAAVILWQQPRLHSARRAAVLAEVESAEAVVLILQSDRHSNTSPIVVFSTDLRLAHMHIHGVPVIHADRTMRQRMHNLHVEVLVVPEQDHIPEEQQRVLREADDAGVRIEQLAIRTNVWHPTRTLIPADSPLLFIEQTRTTKTAT